MPKPIINISSRQGLIFCFFIVLFEFLTYIANDMIMPGMVHVIETFHGNESAVATSLTLYVLGGASLQLFLGPLSDRYGRRPVMLVGVVLFLICTVAIACSNSMAQFLTARYFQGMGLCFIGVVGYATLQEIYEEMEAVRLAAVLTNVASLAPLLGPLAGAAFILYFNWRWIFVITAFFTLIAFYGLWHWMPEPIGATRNDGSRIPRVSLSPKVIFSNYLQLITNRSFMFGALTAGILYVACLSWIAISPVIIIVDAKRGVIEYALWQLPVFGSGLIGAWILNYLTHHYSLKRIITLGSIVTVLGLWLTFLLPLLISDYFVWLVPGLVIYGLGLGIACSPLHRYVLFSTTVSKGTGYAMISIIGMSSYALGIEIGNLIYASHNNLLFGAYCAATSIAYIIGLLVTLHPTKPSRAKDWDRQNNRDNTIA